MLSLATSVAAQSITDAGRLEFTPSPDHNAKDPASGVSLVSSYRLDVFLAGTTAPLQTVNLGKPAPEADGKIRVNFVTLLSITLVAAKIYDAVVSAVGPGGVTPSARSNTFGFTASCPPTISATNVSLPAAGGSANVTVTANAVCPWVATSKASWIKVSAGATGLGSGTVTLQVAANTGTSSRTGTVTIGTSTFTVTQAGTTCSYALSSASQTFTASGGTSTVTVTTAASCTWSATSGSSFVTITNGASRVGSGSVTITAASNSTSQSRTATLTIAGKNFIVTQQAGTCTYTVTPLTVAVSPAGGSGSIRVTTLSTCAWSASSGITWISLSGSRTGSGSIAYTITANPNKTTRSATVTVAGMSVRFTQAIPTQPPPPTNLRIVKK